MSNKIQTGVCLLLAFQVIRFDLVLFLQLIGVDLDGVRKEQQAIRSRIKSLEDELKAIDEDIASLQEELAAVTQKKDKSYETLNELRKTRDEGV